MSNAGADHDDAFERLIGANGATISMSTGLWQHMASNMEGFSDDAGSDSESTSEDDSDAVPDGAMHGMREEHLPHQEWTRGVKPQRGVARAGSRGMRLFGEGKKEVDGGARDGHHLDVSVSGGMVSFPSGMMGIPQS